MISKEKIYEVEFEQLKQNNDIGKLDSKVAILEAKLDVDTEIGRCRKSIGDILSLKSNDVIILDKFVDENLDIKINGEQIANGESIIIDNKVAVRINKLNNK